MLLFEPLELDLQMGQPAHRRREDASLTAFDHSVVGEALRELLEHDLQLEAGEELAQAKTSGSEYSRSSRLAEPSSREIQLPFGMVVPWSATSRVVTRAPQVLGSPGRRHFVRPPVSCIIFARCRWKSVWDATVVVMSADHCW